VHQVSIYDFTFSVECHWFEPLQVTILIVATREEADTVGVSRVRTPRAGWLHAGRIDFHTSSPPPPHKQFPQSGLPWTSVKALRVQGLLIPALQTFGIITYASEKHRHENP
jgi:hypothetical protein